MRSLLRSQPWRFVKYRLGLLPAQTQVTESERACLVKHAAGRRNLVEIGVMEGVSTAALRRVMAPDGVLTGIDPHYPGTLGINFQRWIATREVGRTRRGHVILLRQLSSEASRSWAGEIDFLFIDGDHSWAGIERDWREWSPFIVAGGIVALHDSRSVAGRADLDSVRFTQAVIQGDTRFREIDAAESLTVLERVTHPETHPATAS